MPPKHHHHHHEHDHEHGHEHGHGHKHGHKKQHHKHRHHPRRHSDSSASSSSSSSSAGSEGVKPLAVVDHPPPVVEDAPPVEPPVVEIAEPEPTPAPAPAPAPSEPEQTEPEPVKEKKKVEKKKFFSPPEMWGGEGGDAFDDGPNIRPITKIIVNFRRAVNGIVVQYGSGANDKYAEHGRQKGGMRSKTETIDLANGEHITKISLRYGNLIDSIAFETDKGRSFGPWGGEGGDPVEVTAPEADAVLVGFKGSAGRYVDSLGFHWGPAN